MKERYYHINSNFQIVHDASEKLETQFEKKPNYHVKKKGGGQEWQLYELGLEPRPWA